VEAVTKHGGWTGREGVTPLRWRTEPQDNLPLQLTRFIGREQELVQVRDLLQSERLVTLTGVGGIGKTRLAIEVADQLRDVFRHGVWLVDLAPLAEPALVSQAVAGPLGVRAETEVSVQQALVEFLRTRHLLLVLDNCEHLVDACARLTEAILKACPAVHVLATSREPLHITGEATWRVPALAETEAVRLFTDRAQAASGLSVAQDNAPAVARLCQKLDGIALAIELAAARTSVLSVEQIATRLDDRFRLLVGGGRTAPARQQTLRALLDWSYELLSDAERQLLDALSVFAGGWTLEAADQVGSGTHTPAEEVFELLARLVDKSLVQVDPLSNGQLGYRLLESVRDYASEQLRARGELDSVHRRHCAYFCEVARQAELSVLWGPGGLEWLARLDRDYANMRAALGWSLSEEGDARSGLELAGHLAHYWYTRGDRAEGRTWLTRAIARVDAPADPAERRAWAWAVLWAGGLAHGQSDYDAASRLVTRALETFQQLEDPPGIGWALSFVGHIARARSELKEAETALEGAIAAFAGIGDEVSQILPMAALGFTVCIMGDQPRASQLLEQSVSLARRTGANGRLAIVSVYLGQVAFAQGDTRRAAVALQEGLKLSREWDSAWGMAECLEGLAVVAGADRQAPRAARLLGAAARLREAIGAPVHPVDRADHERTVSLAQSVLGAEAYGLAWAEGQSMPIDAVVGYAVGTADDPVAPAGPPAAPQLTSREREVAALIARGMSNRQIAESLVIAERTVTNHVEHIFNKLGFRSRAQVATWITAQQRSP